MAKVNPTIYPMDSFHSSPRAKRENALLVSTNSPDQNGRYGGCEGEERIANT